MKSHKISLTTQAVMIISALLLLVNLALGSVLLNRSRALMRTLINARMLDIVTTSADMLDGDALRRIGPDSVGAPEYQAIYNALKVFQDNIDFDFIYTIRDMGDGTFIFLVDPHPTDPGEYGGPVAVTDALKTAAQGVPAVDEEPYRDAWGRFYSAYCPVFDSAGEVAGIVAVDFNAAWYEGQLSGYAGTVVLFSLLSLCVGGAVVFMLTSKVRGRLRDLNAELGELNGDMAQLLWDLRVTPDSPAPDAPPDNAQPSADGAKRPKDEMLELGESIHSMRETVRKYMEHMRAQANSMITSLAADYRSVYYIDLDTGEGICYRAHSQLDNGLREGEHFSFHDVFTDYANRYVAESDREGFLRILDPAVIRAELEREPILVYRYLIVKDGRESYETFRMAGVRRPGEGEDDVIHAVGAGFADVDRATRETLAQRQALSDALAAAEEANKAKSAFLSSMSHEIRTPMNAILGLDSIALNDPNLPDSTRTHLEKIGVSAQHLLSLINDILDMSRIEADQMSLKSEEFSLSGLLADINAMLDSQCREKGLTYDCHIIGQPGDYYIGDDTKLKQVLINILGNAVKFTHTGGSVTLNVERAAQFDGKSALRFAVSDTGIGMDKAFLPKLYKAFSQEDSSTTSKYGSTGIGLAISKNIVEMMNGKIEVESEKGVGTTFTVTVTLVDGRRDVSQEESAFRLVGLHALVIDDDPIAREHAQLTLSNAGVTSETAASGPEGVEMVRLRHARREPYDVILVDWKMPGMDGLETTRQIRQILKEDSAVIILTAYNWDDALKEALQAGVNSFIAKPLSSANILDEFRLAVRKNAQAPPPHKADLTGRRILLAEDTPINAEIMMDILDMREMEVDHAENGKIAVDMFASHPEGWYDAILMDMRMPEMDGLDATIAIRAMSRADAKAIPIIAVTANAFDEDVQRSLQAGLNAHLSKPVEPDTLFSTLEQLIK